MHAVAHVKLRRSLRALLSCSGVLLGCGPAKPEISSSSGSETGATAAETTTTTGTGEATESGGSSPCPEGEIECPDGSCQVAGFVPTYVCCEHGGECPEPWDECSLSEQDCPEGEKCVPYNTTPGAGCLDRARCVPAGDRQIDELCVREGSNDDCAVGLYCATTGADAPGVGVCTPFCDINDPSSCASFGQPEAMCECSGNCYDPFCDQSCDPLGSDCPDGRACYISRPACYPVQGCEVPVHGPDDGYAGDLCNVSRQCRPGLTCADSSELADCAADRCCTPFCDCQAADPGECTNPDESCNCIWQNRPPPFDRVGVCGL